MKFIASINGQEHVVEIRNDEAHPNQYLLPLDGRDYEVDARTMLSEIVSTVVEGKSYDIDIEQLNIADPLDGRLGVRVSGRAVYLDMLDERRKKMRDAQSTRFSESGLIRICSPMPGKVMRLLVSEGDIVTEGQGLVVVEAMKMENELKAPKGGQVKDLLTSPGASVDSGALLLTIE